MRTPVLCLVLLVASALHADAGGDAAKPLPIDKTAILKADTYFVEGRVRIGKRTEITLARNTKIVGRGAGATIEVEGEVQGIGGSGAEIIFEDVTIEPQAAFVEIHLQTAKFQGKSRGIVSAKDAQVAGRVALQDVEFGSGATLDLVMQSGAVEILDRSNFFGAVSIKAVSPPGSTGNSVKVLVKHCAYQGWFRGGLHVEGVSDVSLIESAFEGEAVSLVNCGLMTLDGDLIQCKRVELTEPVAGRFVKSKFQRCDIQCDKIVLTGPSVEAIPEALKIDGCWFGGETSPRLAKQKFIDDHDSMSSSGVVALVTRPEAKPLQIAGNVKR
jgi:hypothetical protein